MSAEIYAEQKILIQNRTGVDACTLVRCPRPVGALTDTFGCAAELIEIGQLIQKNQKQFQEKKTGRSERRQQQKADLMTVNKYKQMVFVLERDYDDLKVCHSGFKTHNPLIPVLKLFLGVLSAILSLLWLLQIVLFLIADADSFLNKYFIWFEEGLKFPLFGTITVAIFAMYLQCCVAKGCFKVGVRCFCFSLHPMEIGETYMNSFLFNLMLILICTVPIVQFSTAAFADYARLTVVENIFGAQVKHLRFFVYFFENQVFEISFFAMSMLTLLYLTFHPTDKPANARELVQRLSTNNTDRKKQRDDVMATKSNQTNV